MAKRICKLDSTQNSLHHDVSHDFERKEKGLCCCLRCKILKNLAKSFRNLQSVEGITVSLIEENIDQWDLVYKYPNNTEVQLRIDFYLKEPLPPKITVIFPASIQYVCFQELGTNSWKGDNDVVTLIYALQSEFSHRGQTREAGKTQTKEEAEKHWLFVKNAHMDWGYVDVVELTQKLEELELSKLRQEGAQSLKEEEQIIESK